MRAIFMGGFLVGGSAFGLIVVGFGIGRRFGRAVAEVRGQVADGCVGPAGVGGEGVGVVVDGGFEQAVQLFELAGAEVEAGEADLELIATERGSDDAHQGRWGGGCGHGGGLAGGCDSISQSSFGGWGGQPIAGGG